MSAPPSSEIPTLSSLPLVIATARLRLRPQHESDAEALFPYVSDPVLPRYMTWKPHASVDETRAWLRANVAELVEGTCMAWTIEYEGAPVGCISLDAIRWTMRALRVDCATLGYWIAPHCWGKGLMTEAAITVTRWSFETLGLHKVHVMCFDANEGSRRVIEKAGYRFVGRAEDDVWRDGRWFAHLRYELTAPEWRAQG